MSWFSNVELSPPIEAFDVIMRFYEDSFPNKVNLTIGGYRTDKGMPWVLPVVKKAEKTLANDETLNKEYLPILGLDEFCKASTMLLLGEDSPALVENRAFGIQSLSGCGALRIGAEFLRKILGSQIFYYSSPTWNNHIQIFKNAGFIEAREYRYSSPNYHGLDYDGLIEDLKTAPERSVIILQSCAHNPTGYDPTEEQWRKIAKVMKEKNLFPFFDTAHHGFATGDLDKDAYSVRYFVEQGFELFCAQAYSKILGLYNERIGNLVVVLKNHNLVESVKSQFSLIVRGMYSNPPSHGARIVTYVLTNPDVYDEWKANIQTILSRIKKIRILLKGELEKLKTPGDWNHITEQTGMVTYTGLNKLQCEHMIKKHHIYMLSSGQVSTTALNSSNLEYVAKAIHETVMSLPN